MKNKDYIEIVQKIKDKDWILCDFFDTLVERDCSEDLVIREWANKVSEFTQFRISAHDLYELRKKCPEKIIRESGKEEIKYSELLQGIYTTCCKLIPEIDLYTFVAKSQDIASTIELTHLRVLQPAVDVLQEAKKKNVKVAVVSDYIMSENVLQFYARSLGFDEYIDKYFVSCDYSARKRTGNLYKAVKANIAPVNAIMIGDNFTSDCTMAEANNFEAHLVKGIQNKPKEHNCHRYDSIDEIRKLYKGNKEVPFARIAFGLYVLIESVYQELLQTGKHKLFFLSREGYFLKKLFDKYQENKEKKIVSEYLYVSRKSTLMPAIMRNGKVDYSGLFRTYNKLDVETFLRNLSFSKDEIQGVLVDFPFDKDRVIDGFSTSQEFNWLEENENYDSIIRNKYKKENDLFRSYIINLLSDESDEICIFDVGWKGTMQDNIFHALQGIYTLRGFYYGIEGKTNYENNRNIKKGVIFDAFPHKNHNFDFFDLDTHLLEQIMAAPHGSTIGYEYVDGKTEPILDEYTPEDKSLYEASEIVQDHITKLFMEICDWMKYSVFEPQKMQKKMLKEHFKGQMLLDRNAIAYEKLVLNSSTNNFGWFKSGPSRSNKKHALYIFVKDIARLIKRHAGAMEITKYISIKMNARRKYAWKIPVYRLLYLFYAYKIKELEQ